jgi:glycyl-tRNA synthetase beta chain
MADSEDLLFEIGTEELPPTALHTLSQALTHELVGGVDRAGLAHGEVQSFATPRRLGVLIERCALRQPDRETERRGPAVKAAFDADGRPTKAAEGFARSCGVDVSQLERVGTDKGEWLVHRVQETGRAASELLPGIVETALSRLPIPKRMRWGDSDAQFVRPVHWILFLHGEQVVPCRLLDAEAGRMTHGHRFHHPGAIWIGRPGDYAETLEGAGCVVADFARRRQRIREQVTQVARSLGGSAEMDEALLDEVTALVEWPVAIAGSFEERFLEVPHEALILTMKQNQKYFPLFDAEGRLMSHFITVANVDSPRPELIKEGNERVVRPRLADAMFFWEQDGKRRLEERAEALKSLVFEKRLGSMYEKSERVAGLASEVAARIGGDGALAARAGMLSRCDLMTEMVYEFPEMQGIMGGHQARRDGEPEELARAMEELYLPRFSGDRLPGTPTGTAVALADRLDTLVGIFGIGERPTGDKDPFGLRRAALGALRILVEKDLDLDLRALLDKAASRLAGQIEAQAPEEVYEFMLERLRGYYADRGFGHDLFDAVAELRPSSPADIDRRIRAVAAFRELPEAQALAGGNKRIRNILRKAEDSIPARPDPALFAEEAERALASALERIRPEVEPLLAAGEYEQALRTLAGLRSAVDRFFDEVLVMSEDERQRRNRLALLASLGDLFLRVADVSHLQWGTPS